AAPHWGPRGDADSAAAERAEEWEKTSRTAAASSSWGVCEVPRWGKQVEPKEGPTAMVELGITATEFVPQGWLPEEPAARAEAIGEYGLKAVGAFVPLVLHDPA